MEDRIGNVVDPVATMNSHLERIVEVLNQHPSQEESVLVLGVNGFAAQAFSNRMRIRRLVLTATGAGTIILRIGTAGFTWNVPAASLPVWFPFTYVVENGVDVSVAGTAAGASIFVMYASE